MPLGYNHQAQRDPNEINQTEWKVFDIIKKYDFLKDPEAFKNLINTATDKETKADGLHLEQYLSKLGMNLKVEGKIDENTITGINAIISKNDPAITAYKEHYGIDPLVKKDPGVGR